MERLSEYQAVGVSEILLLATGPDALHQDERLTVVNGRLATDATPVR